MTLAALYRQFRRPLQWALALLVLAFLGRLLADSWGQLQGYTPTLEPGLFVLSFVALLATLCLDIVPWQRSLHWLGARLSFGAAARIWFLSNVVRYVPGNIWQPATMLVMLRDRGVDPARSASSIALNWVLSNLTALLLAGVYWTLPATGATAETGDALRLWLLLLVVILALSALHPAVLGRALRFVLERTGRSGTPSVWRFDQVLRLALLHIGVWIAYGIAFSLFWNALSPVAASEVPRLSAAFAAAYAIGFLSLLTPSGLGVREGAMVLLLSGTYPVALVTMMALLSRLWLILGELLCTALVLALTRGRDA